MINPVKQEEHLLRKYGTFDTRLIAKKLNDAQYQWDGSPNKRINEYIRLIRQKLTPTKVMPKAESVEEYFFGDERDGFKLTDDSLDFSKEFVQKIMLVLLNPLEDSFNVVKELFRRYVFFFGVKCKDLPDLLFHNGLKDVTQLYQHLGYEKVNLHGRQTLSRYETKNLQQINEETKDFSEDKKPIFKERSYTEDNSTKNPFMDSSYKKQISKRIDMKKLGSEHNPKFDAYIDDMSKLRTSEAKPNAVYPERPIAKKSELEKKSKTLAVRTIFNWLINHLGSHFHHRNRG
jgi:hypothetical protein